MKRFKKIVSLLLAMVLFISIGGGMVQAFDYSNGITVKNSERLNSVGGNWHYYSFTIDNGLYAYCLDSDLDRPPVGTTFKLTDVGLTSEQKARMAAVMIAAGNLGSWSSNMKKNDGSAMSNSEAFYITQAAVWYARYASNGNYNYHTKSGDNYKEGLIGPNGRIANSNLSNAFNYLKSVADDSSKVFTNKDISIDSSSSEMELNGNVMISKSTIKVNTPNDGKYVVTVSGENAYITNADGSANYGTTHEFNGTDTFKVAVSDISLENSGSVEASIAVETIDSYITGYNLYTFVNKSGKSNIQSLGVADATYQKLSTNYSFNGSYERETYDIDIAKVDENNKTLEGATLCIFTRDGELVKQVVSTKEFIKVSLAAGEYYLQETDAPVGYLINDEKKNFTITDKGELLNSDGDVVVTKALTIDDTLPSIKVRKVSENGIAVKGATIAACKYNQATKEKTDCVEWVTDGTEKVLTLGVDFGTITDGDYIIYEKEAPKGFDLNEYEFIISLREGKLVGDITDGVVTITDKAYLSVSKTDATGQKEIAGADMKLFDKNGKLVDSWTSTTDEHKVYGLNVNEVYEIVEDLAPEGYVPLSTSIYFRMTDEGKVETLNCKTSTDVINNTCSVMSQEEVLKIKNDVTKVKISKIDVTNQEELPGAKLQILHTDGSPVYQNGEILEWTSTNEPHYIEMLPIGSYKLVETFSPEGYVAVSNEVEFEVKAETGIQVVTFENDVTKVMISKKDFTTGEELPGATLQILNSDHTPVYQNGEKLEWVSGDEPHYIEKLPVGEYILVETIRPEGYQEGMIIDGIVTTEYPFEVKDNVLLKIDVFNETIKNVPTTGMSATSTYIFGSMVAFVGIGTVYSAKRKNNEV